MSDEDETSAWSTEQPPPNRKQTGSDGGNPTATTERLLIVGVGASAGGLSALELLLQRLGPCDMALVIFQHLDPLHDSALTEILTHHSVLKVVTARDGQPLLADTIYVVPPAVDVTVVAGTLRLKPIAYSAHARAHPIDAFLCSLALDQGANAVGVLLSGAGNDGTSGLLAIREEGGITFVQRPATAAHATMPQSALDAGCADFCLHPTEIGDELMRVGSHPLLALRRAPALLHTEVVERFFRVLRQAFGVDFSSYKRRTIERRIARRMALSSIERAADYATLVEENRDELAALYGDLLIGVTSFFRDGGPFEALVRVVFPRLVAGRDAGSPIRIWIAGCATGEEAYSMIICLLEYLDARSLNFKVQAFATDINEGALALARHGLYSANIEREVSATRLSRFFSRVDEGYRISRRVRDAVVFARHNLGQDPPFSRLDLVSCRNVLIYLQPVLQKKVVRTFHHALNRDGFLLLGASESVGDASDLFALVEREPKLYLRKSVASLTPLDCPVPLSPRAVSAASSTVLNTERRTAASVQQLADRKVLDRYAPPGVIVDANGHVVQFRGQTARYLAPTPGTATLNLFKLVRPELMATVRTALETARNELTPVVSEAVTVSGSDAFSVAVEVLPLQDVSDHAHSWLVLFRDAASSNESQPVVRSGAGESADQRVERLQRELITNKEYLETVIRELELSNEELQSTNEELQSTNEELQSTNEEQETSKEELQSTNEELATVNEELHRRMAQLAVAKDDLLNVLANVSAPLVLVGADLRIRRFSTAAEKELSLISGDVGRPVSYLANLLNAPKLEQQVSDTISSLRTREQNIRCSNGTLYTIRTVPYQATDQVAKGAVIELCGTATVRRPSEVVSIHELVGKVLSTLPHALMLVDDHMRLIWANRALFDALQVGGEAIGRPLEEAWPIRSSQPEMWRRLEDAVYAGKAFQELMITTHPGARAMQVAAQCFPAELDRPAMTLVVFEESAAGSAAP